MIEGRYVLNDDDLAILDRVKEELKKGVEELKSRDIRGANIEIELTWFVKDLLKH